MAAFPEFHLSYRLGQELFSFLYAAADAHGAMGCGQKNFIILIVWWWHQILSGSS